MNNWKTVLEKPEHDGEYILKGIVNVGTPHVAKCVFIGYWDNGLQDFEDPDGDKFYGVELTGWMPLPDYES